MWRFAGILARMHDIERLLEIMAQLRDPEGGCPWDLEQDFASISPYTIEEAYEVDEAIAAGDLDALRDELGDLLFQVVFQARIAQERGAFDFAGVSRAITEKLVRRHPHVFADAETPATAEAQLASWESLKAAEREAADESPGTPDPFSGIPRRLPALARAAKIAGRLAHVESEREGQAHRRDAEPSVSSRLAEIRGQLDRLEADLAPAAEARDPSDEPPLARSEARCRVGEGLQAWVGLARALGIDPEQALREADDARIQSVRNELAKS